MLKTDGTVPVVNIFKAKRVKGWWPFYVKKENEEMELTVRNFLRIPFVLALTISIYLETKSIFFLNSEVVFGSFQFVQ